MVAALAAKQPGQRAKRAQRMTEAMRCEPERTAERASEAERLRSGAVREAMKGGVTMDQVYIILVPNGKEKAKRAYVVTSFQDLFDVLLALGAEKARSAEVYRASRLQN